MANKTMISAIASVLALAASSGALAQPGGPTPRDGACFYEHPNFRGEFFCLEANDSIDRMPSGANDRVSSIRVVGRADVRVYRDARFRGDSLVFGGSVANLKDEAFDDAISSIRVEGRSFRGSARGRPAAQNPDVIVRRAYQDVLERDPDPGGLRRYRSHIIDDGWTEQQVRDALRRSDEYREKNTMTRAKAEQIVRQAYLNVLGREPDSASRGYVDAVFRGRLTQDALERELRNSSEYRGRRAIERSAPRD